MKNAGDNQLKLIPRPPWCKRRTNGLNRWGRPSSIRGFMDEIREKRKARDLPRLKLVTPFELRYDETYFKGMAWLDSQAGTELSEKNIVVEFSDEV